MKIMKIAVSWAMLVASCNGLASAKPATAPVVLQTQAQICYDHCYAVYVERAGECYERFYNGEYLFSIEFEYCLIEAQSNYESCLVGCDISYPMAFSNIAPYKPTVLHVDFG